MPGKAGTTAAAREARLKAALKANMTRRKSQARARQAQDGDAPGAADRTDPDPDADGQQ